MAHEATASSIETRASIPVVIDTTALERWQEKFMVDLVRSFTDAGEKAAKTDEQKTFEAISGANTERLLTDILDTLRGILDKLEEADE
jgi:hypothetical protein